MACRLVLAAAAAAALLVFALPGLARPPAAVSDCRLVVDGPFLYVQADLIIPESYIACTTEQGRISLSSVLTRDGVQVAGSSRTCRNRERCDLSIDVSAPNIPGDQVWCVTARGSVGRQAFGPATACESGEF
jgi:hypothetical protein